MDIFQTDSAKAYVSQQHHLEKARQGEVAAK
jgi:hypothetical protein